MNLSRRKRNAKKLVQELVNLKSDPDLYLVVGRGSMEFHYSKSIDSDADELFTNLGSFKELVEQREISLERDLDSHLDIYAESYPKPIDEDGDDEYTDYMEESTKLAKNELKEAWANRLVFSRLFPLTKGEKKRLKKKHYEDFCDAYDYEIFDKKYAESLDEYEYNEYVKEMEIQSKAIEKEMKKQGIPFF